MCVLTRARLVVVGVALVCLAGSTPWQPNARLNAQSAPQPLPTFRSGVDIVQLDVVVLDRNRKPVAGLTAKDFTILEDDKPRPLAAFATVTLPEWPATDPTTPAAATWTREVSSDVSTNQRPNDGRVAVIVMDRSIPMEQPTVAARKIAHAIVDALGPNDVAAIVRTGHFNDEGFQQGFTADRARLRRSIDAPYMGMTNPPGMTLAGLVRSDWNPTVDCDFRCELEQLTSYAQALEPETRRQKTMFLIASRLPISDVSGRDEGIFSEYRGRLFDALSRSNVTVNVLDPVGLQTLTKTADAFPAVGNPGFQQRIGPNTARQEELKVLPAYTGGQTVLNTNTPQAAIPRLFDETRSYYLLAYQSGDTKRVATKRSIRGIELDVLTAGCAAHTEDRDARADSDLGDVRAELEHVDLGVARESCVDAGSEVDLGPAVRAGIESVARDHRGIDRYGGPIVGIGVGRDSCQSDELAATFLLAAGLRVRRGWNSFA